MRPRRSNTFFSGRGGSAGLSAAADAPGDTDGQSVELKLPRAASFAGFQLGVPRTAPGTPPSFSFRSSVTGPSDGSPRLVITFSDGDQIFLRPLAWTARTWTRVSGAGTEWEDAGAGSCPALHDVSYRQALACQVAHRASVTGAYVVSDGVSTARSVVLFVDSVSYGGSTITSSIVQHGAARLASAKLSVSGRTGRGTLSTGCNVPVGDQCHYALTLRAGGHAIGRLRGTVQGGVSGNVSIRLNARGRALLRRSRLVHAIATGTVVNDVGFGFQLRERVTIRR